MILVQNLTAGYGLKPVISRLSFSISQKTSPLVLIGRNGSGKSTLLKAILGQIPYNGIIDFQPQVSSIAWLPQQYQLSIRIPVLDFIALGALSNSGLFPARNSHSEELAFAALTELGMPQLANKQTDELSGGEWQMICLAQLRVQETNVWLLDEPTAFLDVYHKKQVFGFLWKQAEMGKTIVLSTHDLPFLPTNSGSYIYIKSNGAEEGIITGESIRELMHSLSLPEYSEFSFHP